MRILDAEGVGSLTLENLTQRLGVTQGSFYWHFKSQTHTSSARPWRTLNCLL
jgi:AcrR family transcriptional regulator